jgi:hypothetical protein
VHPYEDEQYLKDHPEVRGRESGKYTAPSGPPPENRRRSWTKEADEPRPSTERRASRSQTRAQNAHPVAHPDASHEKRGFFGKMKDKAIGTKEEREAQKAQEAEVCLSRSTN